MAGPIRHFRSAIWQGWQSKVATDLCKRKGFRGGFGVDIYGSHQLLVSSHLRERDKMLLRANLSGGVWNGFLHGNAKKEDIPCRFCGAPDNDGHLFWDCTFLPFVERRNSPEFLPLMSRDRTNWPRCLLWHGWLPGLISRTTGSSWAIASSDLASYSLENALGLPIVPGILFGIRMMSKIWLMMSLSLLTFGLMVVRSLSLILMLRLLELVLLFILRLSSLTISIGVMLKILMIHMRAALTSSQVSFGSEGWVFGSYSCSASLFWYSYWYRQFECSSESGCFTLPKVARSPLHLVRDGDLLATIHSMLCLRGFSTVQVSKVKGHATRAMLDSGDDAAADLGAVKAAGWRHHCSTRPSAGSSLLVSHHFRSS